MALNSTVLEKILLDWTADITSTCSNWMPPNHVLFQMANTFFFASLFAPTSLCGHLYLRSCLTIGSIFMSLFAYAVCSVDMLAWNILFTVINALYVAVITYKLHPFIRFPHEVELVYQDLFQPLKVSRKSFQKIYRCTRQIETLKPHDVYCVEGVTPVDRLSLLMSGRVAVLKNGRTIHLIDSHQFLDSPEWFGVGANATYQVTIMALEESRLIIWHRDKLKLSICNEPYLQAVLDNVLGKDVVRKLLFVTETIGNNHNLNGTCPNVAENSLSEQAKLIVPIHKALDQVTKRSLSAGSPYSFWSLSRINEDSETNV
ncbi:Blood vessel epicardial substance [Halotydeus destructor]|nr:Blood vessel epicardial substance [Halotydeus destructor]